MLVKGSPTWKYKVPISETVVLTRGVVVGKMEIQRERFNKKVISKEGWSQIRVFCHLGLHCDKRNLKGFSCSRHFVPSRV